MSNSSAALTYSIAVLANLGAILPHLEAHLALPWWPHACDCFKQISDFVVDHLLEPFQTLVWSQDWVKRRQNKPYKAIKSFKVVRRRLALRMYIYKVLSPKQKPRIALNYFDPRIALNHFVG